MNEIEKLLWDVHMETVRMLYERYVGLSYDSSKTKKEMIDELKNMLNFDAIKLAYPEALQKAKSVGDIQYVKNAHFSNRNPICKTCGQQ